MKQAARRRPVSRLPREQRLSGLLAAARAVFSQHGEGATTAEVAERAGIAESTIFHYFPTKRSLLIGVVEDWYAETMPDYPRALEGIKGAKAKLRYLIWNHLKAVHDEPILAKFVLEIKNDDVFKDTQVYELNKRYGDAIVSAIDDGIAERQIRPDISATLSRDIIFGIIEYLTRPYIQQRGDFGVDDLADEITDHIYFGFSGPPPKDLRVVKT